MIEHLGKKEQNDAFVDYTMYFYRFLDKDAIKNYRKKLQCFRHAKESDLSKRAAIIEVDKQFYIKFGIFLVEHMYEVYRIQNNITPK